MIFGIRTIRKTIRLMDDLYRPTTQMIFGIQTVHMTIRLMDNLTKPTTQMIFGHKKNVLSRNRTADLHTKFRFTTRRTNISLWKIHRGFFRVKSHRQNEIY